MRLTVLIAAVVALAAGAGMAEVRETQVVYYDGNVRLLGFLAWDDQFAGPRPGVLVIHEWWGLNDYARDRARQLARLGYVAMAADIYGEGKTADTFDAASALAKPFRDDRDLLRRRAQAGLDALKKQELVDADSIAAIGYCFGGTAVLELARSGAEFQAAVSFHGGLATPKPAEPGVIKAPILVLTGGADPNVPDKEVAAFMDEMRKAGANWQVDVYGGAMHSFTNPASNSPDKGMAYNEQADRRSWSAMMLFFRETIGTGAGYSEEAAAKGKLEGVGRFVVEKIYKPTTRAAVNAGEKVKGAAQKAAHWTREKIEGQ